MVFMRNIEGFSGTPARFAREARMRCTGETRLRERGQGTTEYAILVGVLVVIAIIAITVFRPKLKNCGTR